MVNAMISSCKLLISIVSHGQMELVNKLLLSLDKCNLENCRVVVRSNIDEPEPIFPQQLDCIHIKNLRPSGFSANHNKNFELLESTYFAVLNPDIIIKDEEIFNKITNIIDQKPKNLVCPRILNEKCEVADSVRRFPTLTVMLRRLLYSRNKVNNYPPFEKSIEKVDWCAGMFQVYPSTLYREMRGFDEKYFLYCEDVDMGLRLVRNGYSTFVPKEIFAIHYARHDSHRKIKYLILHIKSFFRLYFNLYFKSKK